MHVLSTHLNCLDFDSAKFRFHSVRFDLARGRFFFVLSRFISGFVYSLSLSFLVYVLSLSLYLSLALCSLLLDSACVNSEFGENCFQFSSYFLSLIS